ncbi:MAG: hypothetical protein ACYST6_07105 [Planctomycetota bacterium]|jgi:hypothetical protein
MNMANFKEVYKSYSSLVPPLIILLAGVIVLVPSKLISRNLRQKAQAQSVRMGRDMQTLKVWPNGQWEREQERQDIYGKDANQIDFLAKQSTQRQLLSYKIFPEPKDDSQFIFTDFGRQFRNAVDQLIAAINAGDCPTPDELDQFKRGSQARRSLSRNLSEVDAAIEDNLCREKAERAAVYVRPVDLDGYDFWGEYSFAQAKTRDEAIRNCWYSQLAYWVIDDAIDTIRALNGESSSVFTSPVKRLLSVTFPKVVTKGKTRYLAPRSTKDDKDVLPSYVLTQRDGFTVPYTRRTSDPDVDIVHFQVDVVVSTDAVLSFMQELCRAKQHIFKGWDKSQPEQVFQHNQITILRYNIDSVRRDDRTHTLYRYGEDAVVKLSLICEYIFDAKIYDEVKPPAVKSEVVELRKELDRASRRKRGRRRGKTGAAKKTKSKSKSKKDALVDF